MRRPEWTRSLLDAVESGQLRRSDLGPQQWQQLRNNRNRELARRAATLAGGGAPI